MSDEISTARLLFDECTIDNPDMIKIDEYIIRICNNMEDINTFQWYSWTPLHMACSNGHHEIVKRLLENSNNFKYPIDINAIGGICDETPLHFACEKKCPLTVRTLLLHPNIDVNRGNVNKRTPLHIACWLGRKEIVIDLLKHRNINLNAKTKWCQTPLHNACSNHDSAAVVQLLLEHAIIIDINATDVDGNTPLHNACSNYHLNEEKKDTIRSILKHPSIFINKNNNNNETPLDICKRKFDNHSYVRDKQYYNELIQLFEDFHKQQRWRLFCFLVIYEY